MKTKALQIFLGTSMITVALLLLFLQSSFFASILKDVAQKYMPSSLGIKANFEDLSILFFPPGVVINKPVVEFDSKNILNLPTGTKIESEKIEITFQFFQLMTGAITVNAVNVHKANLRLHLDEDFFLKQEKTFETKKNTSKFWTDYLLKLNFRSIGLIDSEVDIQTDKVGNRPGIHVQGFAKELSVSRIYLEGLPTYELSLDLQKAHIDSEFFKHSLAALKASLEIQLTQVKVRTFNLQESAVSLHASGLMQGNILNPKTLQSELFMRVKGPIEELLEISQATKYFKIPKANSLKGSFSFDGKWIGDVLNPIQTTTVVADIQCNDCGYDAWSAKQSQMKVESKNRTLVLRQGSIKFDDGSINIENALLEFKRKQPLVNAQLNFEHADLRKILGPFVKEIYPIHLFLTGITEIKSTDENKLSLQIFTKLTAKRFSFDNQKPNLTKPLHVLIAVPEIQVFGTAFLDENKIVFKDIDGQMQQTRLKLNGKVDFSTGFDLDIAGPINLNEIQKLADFDIRGHGNLHWTVKGKSPEILFTFDSSLEDAYYLNLYLGKTHGQIIWDDQHNILSLRNFSGKQGVLEMLANGTIDLNEGHDDVDIKVQVQKGTVQDFSEIFKDFISKHIPWYPSSTTGELSGAIVASGKTDLHELSIEGDMEVKNVDLYNEIFRSGKFHAGFRKGSYIAENVNIRKKNGIIKGDISLNSEDILKFNFWSEGLTTYDFDYLNAFDIPYWAPIEARIQGLGKLGKLDGLCHLQLHNGTVRNLPVATSYLDVTAQSGRYAGHASIFGGQGLVKFDLNFNDSPSTFEISANHFNARPLFVGINPNLLTDPAFDSEITGQGKFHFNKNALNKISGQVKLNSYNLSKTGFLLKLSEPFSLILDQGHYSFHGLRFFGEGSDIRISGESTPSRISYDAHGDLNLAIFEFLAPIFASLKGSVKFDAAVKGTPEHPHFSSNVSIENANIRLQSIEQPFQSLNLKFHMDDSLLRIVDFSSKFGGGQLLGQGQAEFFLYKFPILRLQLDFTNPKFSIYPFNYLRTTGRMHITGNGLPYKVNGSFNIAEALIRENFNVSEGGRLLRSSQFLPRKGQDLVLFDFDLEMHAERGIFVRNDLIDAELRGRLKVLGSLKAPKLLGQVDVLHGKLLFKDSAFTIQNGSVTFDNPAFLDPEIDLTGTTDYKGYHVTIFTSGKVSDYKLGFRSEPPLSEPDIVSLLTLGVTSSSAQALRSADREAYTRDEVYSLLFSQSGINKSFNEKLGVKVGVDKAVNTVNMESVFRPSTDASVNVAPRVYLQKEVVKNLKAQVGSTVGVGDSRQQDLNLEYQIGRHTSVSGVYEDQRGASQKNSRTSMGMDLKFKWKFK